MGSGTSRGKKVAPACVSEIHISKSTDDDNTVHPLRRDSHSFKPLNIPKFANNTTTTTTTNSRNSQDCHSEGHDSDFSDDDLDLELERVLEDFDDKEDCFSKRKHTTPKKSSIRSKTYGFCTNFRRVHSDNDFHDKSTPPHFTTTEPPGEPRGPDEGSGGEKDKKTRPTPTCNNNQQNGLLTRDLCVEPAPRPEKEPSLGDDHGPYLVTSIVQYDGSELELMDTIEKEFS